MKFEITILGCGGALPTLEQNPSSQIIEYSNKFYLIDCGEGTQVQLRKYKKSILKINQIFISHLHGDHYFGIFGLLTTMHLLGRTKELNLYADAKIKEIIEVNLRASYTVLSYQIIYHDISKAGHTKIFEDKHIEVYTIPLKHRISCHGFLFKEKPLPRNMIKHKIDQYQIPHYELNNIKAGADYIDHNGQVIQNKELTTDPPPSRSYAYCSDTAYYKSIIDIIKGVNALYHESTFEEMDIDKAKKTYHSTAKQAAKIALQANVNQLFLGHYSARYNDLTTLFEEAKSIFSNVYLSETGTIINL